MDGQVSFEAYKRHSNSPKKKNVSRWPCFSLACNPMWCANWNFGRKSIGNKMFAIVMLWYAVIHLHHNVPPALAIMNSETHPTEGGLQFFPKRRWWALWSWNLCVQKLLQKHVGHCFQCLLPSDLFIDFPIIWKTFHAQLLFSNHLGHGWRCGWSVFLIEHNFGNW